MKRFLSLLLILVLSVLPALADPLPMLEDYAEDLVIPYDESDPSAGVFSYSYRYPQVDENAEGGMGINVFFSELLDYENEFIVPMIQDAYVGSDTSTMISYTVTCNNDDYFSVLIRTEKNIPDHSQVTWKGHVFSRKNGISGSTYSLPMLLGILSPTENDEWLQEYQTEKAETLVRQMVWSMIEDNAGDVDYNGLSEEDLDSFFFPSEDFFLDENGDPVFYLQPYDILDEVPEGTDLFTFPIALEDILDEL